MPIDSDAPGSHPPDGTESLEPAPDLHRPEVHAALERYWRRNVAITVGLLLLWALAGLGCGILFADHLNQYRLLGSGFPLGFWFAHQGSIIVFVLLILVYCVLINRLDARHHRDLEQLNRNRRPEA